MELSPVAGIGELFEPAASASRSDMAASVPDCVFWRRIVRVIS
jgi:hypothetical protein